MINCTAQISGGQVDEREGHRQSLEASLVFESKDDCAKSRWFLLGSYESHIKAVIDMIYKRKACDHLTLKVKWKTRNINAD